MRGCRRTWEPRLPGLIHGFAEEQPDLESGRQHRRFDSVKRKRLTPLPRVIRHA